MFATANAIINDEKLLHTHMQQQGGGGAGAAAGCEGYSLKKI